MHPLTSSLATRSPIQVSTPEHNGLMEVPMIGTLVLGVQK
jgi:hypothetical protein